jgi:subtilisin family serine protease
VVGVAPGLRLYSVRVLDKRGGWWSTVICGIDWVASTLTDADAANDIAVANMSFGGEGDDDGECGRQNDDPFHQALCATVALGVVFVAAAGNTDDYFTETVPAAYDEVLTVTAVADYDGKRGGHGDVTCYDSGRDDHAASFSSYASSEGDDESGDAGHTIAAPGVCILSTLPRGKYGFSSGTSSAAPHVTGLVARCLAELACPGPPAEVIQYVRTRAELGTREDPGYGFVGDPLREIDDYYYGFLARPS